MLEGQLCFSLNLSLTNSKRAGIGLRNGLLLLLDSGNSGHSQQKEEQLADQDIVSLNLEAFQPSKSSARIYLNTLASFTGYRTGSYAMSSLKRMTGTKGFMELPDQNKNCHLGTLEDCAAGIYTEKVQKECYCVPWSLSKVITYGEVNPALIAVTVCSLGAKLLPPHCLLLL